MATDNLLVLILQIHVYYKYLFLSQQTTKERLMKHYLFETLRNKNFDVCFYNKCNSFLYKCSGGMKDK